MTTIYQGGTNGGANRFFEKGGQLLVAGESVSGRQVVTQELIIDLWDPVSVRDNGDVKNDSANPTIDADGVTVRLGGAGVQGNLTFTFATEKAAGEFEAFLETLGDAGYLADIF